MRTLVLLIGLALTASAADDASAIAIGDAAADGWVPVTASLPLAVDETVVLGYQATRRDLALIAYRAQKAQRSDRPTPLTWWVPADAAKLKPRLAATRTVASLDDLRLKVSGLPGGDVPLRALVAWGDAWVAFPASHGGVSEAEAAPRVLRRGEINEVRIEPDASFAWSRDAAFEHALAVLGPPPKDPIASIVTLRAPGTKQDEAMACVINAFKLLLAYDGHGMTVDEIAKAMGRTAQDFERHGTPIDWFLKPDGGLYTALRITDHAVFRARIAPTWDWWTNGDATRAGEHRAVTERLVVLPRGTSDEPSLQKRKHMNWAAHGFLKLLVATGRPVGVDIHSAGAGHVMTVWGYDVEKRSYCINDGSHDQLTWLQARALDENWAESAYAMFALGFPTWPSDAKPVAAAPAAGAPPAGAAPAGAAPAAGAAPGAAAAPAGAAAPGDDLITLDPAVWELVEHGAREVCARHRATGATLRFALRELDRPGEQNPELRHWLDGRTGTPQLVDKKDLPAIDLFPAKLLKPRPWMVGYVDGRAHAILIEQNLALPFAIVCGAVTLIDGSAKQLEQVGSACAAIRFPAHWNTLGMDAVEAKRRLAQDVLNVAELKKRHPELDPYPAVYGPDLEERALPAVPDDLCGDYASDGTHVSERLTAHEHRPVGERTGDTAYAVDRVVGIYADGVLRFVHVSFKDRGDRGHGSMLLRRLPGSDEVFSVSCESGGNLGAPHVYRLIPPTP